MTATAPEQETCQFDEDAFEAIIGQLKEIAAQHLVNEHHIRVSLDGSDAARLLSLLAEQDALLKSMERTLAMACDSMQQLRRTRRDLAALLGEAES